MKTILVALDCSSTSERVIEAIDNFYLQETTKIILAHVLPAPNSDLEVEPNRPHPSSEALYPQVEQQLQYYQTQLPESHSEIEIVSGDAAEEIICLANIHQADLIVIGTRGLTGVKRVIEGSVSSLVVADAPCSVLVVKPQAKGA